MPTRDSNGRYVKTATAAGAPASTTVEPTRQSPALEVDDVVRFEFTDPITGAVLDGRAVVLEVHDEHVVLAQLVNGALSVPAAQVRR